MLKNLLIRLQILCQMLLFSPSMVLLYKKHAPTLSWRDGVIHITTTPFSLTMEIEGGVFSDGIY